MPANLTIKYLKAEEKYRQAATIQEELLCLEDMFREAPKHKGSEKLQAELKRKISKTKKEILQTQAAPKRAAAARLARQGAGRAILVGGPNAGKSRLLASLTHATPEVAPYPFTTRRPTPGMMSWEDVLVQLVDTPPITADLLEPEVLSLLRGAELALLVFDAGADAGVDACGEVLARLQAAKTRLARVSHLDENDIGVAYTQAMLVVNKWDDPAAPDRLALLHEFHPFEVPEVCVSCQTGEGLATLRHTIYTAMDVVRVYTKAPTAKEPDFTKPFTIRRGGVLADVAELVHRDLARRLKGARVWGSHVHPGERVRADYVLHDQDIVELHV